MTRGVLGIASSIGRRRKLLWRLVDRYPWLRGSLSLLFIYLLFVVMFAAFQRSLIYLPTREARIEPREAYLPRGQVHTVTVRAEDQLELRGWLVLADGRRAEDREGCDRELASGRRVVIYFNGNAGNRRYRVPEISILTGLGMDVFIFDYRGYGDNPGSPTEEMLSADARAIWSYVTHERQVQADRVLLYGESLGGAVAVGLAAELCEAEEAPAGVMLRSAFSSLVDAGSYHYPWLPVRFALLDRFPAIDKIPQVTCPILQMHGARDRIMPIRFGRALFDAASEQSSSRIRKQFVELPGAGHNDVTDVAAEEMRSAIAEFLSRLDAR